KHQTGLFRPEPVQLDGDDRPIAHRGETVDRPEDRGDFVVLIGRQSARGWFWNGQIVQSRQSDVFVTDIPKLLPSEVGGERAERDCQIPSRVEVFSGPHESLGRLDLNASKHAVFNSQPKVELLEPTL